MGRSGMARLAVVAGLLGSPGAQAVPDGGPPLDLESLPRGAEHRALEKQVELLRAEAQKPRGWFDRDRKDKLTEEVRQAEAVLHKVNALHETRVLSCQSFWLERSGPRQPGQVPHPAYFACPEKARVPDELVRAIRRQDEVQRRLKAKGLEPAVRKELEAEDALLTARVERAAGLTPLTGERAPPVLDGGVDDTPSWQPEPPPLRVQPWTR